MILSSIESRANVAIASEKFYFSVIKKEVATELEKNQGSTVVVHYRQMNSTLPWRGESTYIVDSLSIRTKSAIDNFR